MDDANTDAIAVEITPVPESGPTGTTSDPSAGQKRRRPDALGSQGSFTRTLKGDASGAGSSGEHYHPGCLIIAGSELVSQARVVATDIGADFDAPVAVQSVRKLELAIESAAKVAADAAEVAARVPGDADAAKASEAIENLASLRAKLAIAVSEMDDQFRRNLKEELVRVTLQVCASGK